MSQAEQGLSLVGNGGWVATTSAAKSDPKIIQGGREGTRRTEPMEPQELHLTSDDEGEEHAVEKKRNKTTRFNSLMRMRCWAIRQQIHFAPCDLVESISNEESQTSSRVVRSLDKLIHALDEVIEALDNGKLRGGQNPEMRRGQPLNKPRKAAVAPMKNVSDEEVQDQEKLESGNLAAPPRPKPPLLTHERSHAHQFPTQQTSSLNSTPIFNSTGSTSLHHGLSYSTSSQIYPYSTSSQILPYSTPSQSFPYSTSSQIYPYSTSSQILPYSTASYFYPYLTSSQFQPYSTPTPTLIPPPRTTLASTLIPPPRTTLASTLNSPPQKIYGYNCCS